MPAFRQRVAQLEVDMKALEITQYRVVSAYDKAKGSGRPDPLSSVLKVKGTELLQATTELAMDVGGPMSMPVWAEELAAMNEPDDVLEARERRPPAATCSCAPRRSTAAPTRSRRTSSPKRCWGFSAASLSCERCEASRRGV